MHVTVKTPSRIHLGMIDLNGSLGRIYGSIGLALDMPSVVLEAKKSDSLEVRGEDRERVGEIVEAFIKAHSLDAGVEIDVKQTIPGHVGLGSGTQLSLAVASALSYINRLNLDVRELALTMNRGTMSGIGVESFKKGGFIIDGGRRVGSERSIPPVVYRSNFPGNWTFILVVPSLKRGISGKEEESAFRKIVPASPGIAKDICWLLQMKMLPALVEKDIEVFGQSLMEVDRKVGEYFKEVQGGVYREKITQSLIDCMLDAGSCGAGQSSWGPAVYGLVEDSRAQKLESAVDSFMKEKGLKGTIIRTHANNRGAEISVMEDVE